MSKNKYRLPFNNTWYVEYGGLTKKTSHSWDIISQRYAYDFEIRKNNFHKTYYAVVEGTLPKEGKFEDYLIKNEKENISYVTTKEKGKYSCLEYTLISSKNNLSLVKINLITGRSHQIRVQFSSRHHPLIGDSKYGNNPKNIDTALFAKTITFTHPTTKEVLTFNLDLPNRYPFNIFK